VNTVLGPPSDIERATVNEDRDHNRVRWEGSSLGMSLTTETTPQEQHWWTELLQTMPEPIQCILQNTQVTCPKEELIDKIMQGSLSMVSDGSYHPDYIKGTAAFRIEDMNRKIILQGVCQTPGAPEDINAYRSEIMGLFALLVSIEWVCKNEEVNGGTITVACDNIRGLERCFSADQRPTCRSRHYDILQQVYDARQRIPIVFYAKHIKGHQTDDQRKGCQIAEMNHEMDLLAKAYLAHCLQFPQAVNQDFAGNCWSVWLDSKKVVKEIDKQVIDHIHGRDLKRLWIKKGRLTCEDIENIDWDAIRYGVKDRTHADSIFMTKLDSKFLPVGTKLLQRREWEKDTCRICEKESEDIQHIFSCEHEDSNKIREEACTHLIVWFQSQQTDPNI